MSILLTDPDAFGQDEHLDFKRDRWGRPNIMQPNGKRIGYTRSSSAAKTIEDTFNLELWARRNVAYGLAHDASLVARVLAIGGDPSTWAKTDKDAVNNIVEAAASVAKAHKAADIGTAVHRLTERLDRGETGVVGGPYQADLDAYTAALGTAGHTIDTSFVECRLVNDDLRMAGTADRILQTADGRWLIADIKTSASVDYGGLGWAAQLASYAGGVLYEVVAEERVDTPPLDQQVGLIIHLPAGQGVCTIYEIDLEGGLKAARLANEIREVRKASKKWISPTTTAAASMIVVPEVVPAAPSVPPPAPDTRRDALRARYSALPDVDRARYLALNVDPDDLDAIETALDTICPFATIIPTPSPTPITPAPKVPVLARNPVEGEPVDDLDFDVLEARYMALFEPERAWIPGLLAQAQEAGVPFNAGKASGARTQRRWRIYDTLLILTEAGLADNELLVEIVATILNNDSPFHPTITVGHAVGSLDADQAATLASISRQLSVDIAAVDLRTRPTG